MKNISVNNLSPDGYSRFFIMACIVKELIGTDTSIEKKVLDVGGASPFMSQAFKEMGINASLFVIDPLPLQTSFPKNYTQGDATNMPYKDSEFDMVISTDVIEHIPPDKKFSYIDESIRVAKDIIVIAGPFNTVGVDDAEREVNKLNKKLFGHDQEWLAEHFKYEKPNLEKVTDYISKKGYQHQVIGTNNLYTWLISAEINLIEAKVGLNPKRHLKLNRDYSYGIITGSELDSPSYRTFIIISKNHKKNVELFSKSLIKKAYINNNSAVKYIGGLFDILSNRMIDQENYNRAQFNNNNSQKDQIDKLIMEKKSILQFIEQQKLLVIEQQKLIELCKPYIKLREKTPRVIKKIISGHISHQEKEK